MAFLQRVVNGGGIIDREYGAGRGRIDLLARWSYRSENGERTRFEEVTAPSGRKVTLLRA